MPDSIPPRRKTIRGAIPALVLALLLAACGGDADSPEGAITGFRGDAENVTESFRAISGHLRERSADLRAAALQHLDAEDDAVAYAALYALSITAEEGESMDALRPFLESDDMSERMLAAGSLVVRGEKAGIPVLIEALDSEEPLAYRTPERPAWIFAQHVLLRYTGQDLGPALAEPEDLDPSLVAEAKPDWERWWAESGGALRWDASAREFR